MKEERKFGDGANIKLDLSSSGLKFLPKNVHSAIVEEACQKAADRFKLELSKDFMYGNPAITLYGLKINENLEDKPREEVVEIFMKEMSKVVSFLNEYILYNLEKTIEKVTGESADKYSKSFMPFTSQLLENAPDTIIIQWS